MAFYILVAVSFYALHFFPEIYGYGIAGAAIIISFSAISGCRYSHLFVIASLIYLLLSESVSYCGKEIGCIGDVSGIVAEVISEPSGRKNRRIGYRAELLAAVDGEGSVFSAKGTVYIISKYADVHFSDRVILKGCFSENSFIASSTDFYRRGAFGRLRAAASEHLKHRLRGKEGELSSLLLLGVGNGSGVVAETARDAGLSHIIALSGMHLAILSAIVSKMLFFIKNDRCRKVLSYIPLILFAYLSGWRPSLLRALLFRFLIDKFQIDEAFVLSDCLLLIILPYSAADLGTVYSFTALSGILMLASPIDSAMRVFHIPRIISSSVSASLAALVFSIPITYSVFGSYRPSAIITALPATLLITLYMYDALLMLIIPSRGIIQECLYQAIIAVFEFGTGLGKSDSIQDFLKLVFAVLCLCSFSFLYQGYLKRPSIKKRRSL